MARARVVLLVLFVTACALGREPKGPERHETGRTTVTLTAHPAATIRPTFIFLVARIDGDLPACPDIVWKFGDGCVSVQQQLGECAVSRVYSVTHHYHASGTLTAVFGVFSDGALIASGTTTLQVGAN